MTQRLTNLTAGDHDVVIFPDWQYGHEYIKWRANNPRRAILSMDGPDFGRLHDADCFSTDQMGDKAAVGHKARICGKRKAVRDWALENNVEVVNCQNCRY